MKQCDIWKARKNWLVSLKHTHFRLMSRFCCCYLVHGLGRGLIFYVSVLCLRLKEFYYKCRNLQYFKHLVQVPSLPDVSFCLVFQSWTLVCSLDLLNTELSLERQGLAATEIPGGRGRGNCTTSHTVTTRMISALGWRVMRAGLMLQYLWGANSEDGVHKPQLLKRKEKQSGKSNQHCLRTSLTLYHQAKLAHVCHEHSDQLVFRS